MSATKTQLPFDFGSAKDRWGTIEPSKEFAWSNVAWKTFGIITRTTMASAPTCQHKDCDDKVSLYRQCPNNRCRTDIAYCAQHGGDDRAFREMALHMKQCNRKAP